MRQSRPDRYNRLPHAEEIPCAAFLGYKSRNMRENLREKTPYMEYDVTIKFP